jgi:quercetin dioxygenase-like cupin family protein
VTYQDGSAIGGAVIARPGEGIVVPGPEGITFKATGDQTGGSIGVMEATSQPGFGGPRHIHHTHDELFYVLTGEFQFLVQEEIVSLGAGSFLFIPRGMIHAPKVVGDQPGKVVIAFVPGGGERAFEEFARLAAEHGDASHLSIEEAQAVARKYGSEFVGPPI